MSGFLRYIHFPARNLKPYNSNFNVISLTETQKKNFNTNQPFDEIPHKDISTLNFQLSSYARSRNFAATWALFSNIHSSCYVLTPYTFTPVLSVCAALPAPQCGIQVHGLMIKTGSDTGHVTKTALMDMYSKCGNLGESVKVFEEMGFKDIVTWNTLLSSFLGHGLAKEAFGVFGAMRRERIEFSEMTLCTLLKASAVLKLVQQGRQIHGMVVVMGRDLVVMGTALIDFYSVLGCISEPGKVYYNCRVVHDDAMRNSFIGGCLRNRNYEEAFSIMNGMRPNVVALTSALAACSENTDLWIGKQIHCVAIRFGFIPFDTQLCNVLLDMYAKCGKILNARSLFDGIIKKDVVSWTSMIDAFGCHGYGVEAVELFKEMSEEKTHVLPNPVTFLAVLSACAHSGLVEEGRECFNSMKEKYGYDPGLEHYVCFIDTLSRAGQIDEVWCVFNNMVKHGVEITTAVWVALVNACSLNLDVSRGEFAAKRLLELEPDKPTSYVLVSNFYAAVEKWDHVDELRSIMRQKGLAKEAGSSWVPAQNCQENSSKLGSSE